MTLHETIKTLTNHNAWRRGDVENAPQLLPAQIGLAMDHAVNVLREVENLIEQKGRHQTESAYRRLVLAAGAK